MYTFVNSTCLGRGVGQQWVNLNIGDQLIFDIYANYRDVYLELSTPFLTNNVYVDFNAIKPLTAGYGGTLNQWLVSIGNTALSTIASLPTGSVRYATYSDAIQAGYKINIAKIGTPLVNTLNKADLVDLVLTRPHYPTDLTQIHDYSLVSVNGYFHRTDTDGTNAYVYAGGKTLTKSNMNTLGIISFLNLGRITKLPIDPLNVYSQGVGAVLKDRTYFKIPVPTTNKSVILCLGGYLVFPEDNVFWPTGVDIWALNINAIPMRERYFESNASIDLSSLGLDVNTITPDLININQLLSDSVLLKYFTLSQSFFIIIDTPNLITNKVYLKSSNVPGVLTSYQNPIYPLFINYGKLAEYWRVPEDGYWSISILDPFYKNYVFNYSNPNINGITVPALLSANPYVKSTGFMLEIGAYR